MNGTAYSGLLFLVLLVVFGPAAVAWAEASPLDAWPYFIGAVVGSFAGYPIVLWGLPRLFAAFPARASYLKGITSPLWVAPPLLGMAFALLGNLHLDTSPELSHDTTMLRVEKCTKYRHCAVFRSWRDPAEEESLRLEPLGVARSIHPGVPASTPAVVTTRAGYFGWEYITGARLR